MYIYGILNSNTSLHLSIPKGLLLDPSQAGAGKTCRAGLEESESNLAYTVVYQDIAALVRDSEIIDPTRMSKDVLARLLIGHQTVIEKVMTTQVTIIPMQFGTFARDEDEVRDVLIKGYNLIKEIFTKVKDKIEIDIASTWSDFNSIIKEAGEEKEIKEFKEKLLSNPKEITAEDQMKAGFMLKKALDEKRDNIAKEIQDTLKTFCVDFKTHELMDDKMLVNTALLIDKDKLGDFDKKVEELNDKFNEKINFRCVGPLPAYSFYALEVKKLEFEEIVWAKEKLGLLNESAAKEDIKKAYHVKAISLHPDKNLRSHTAEKEFDDAARAHKALLEYCQGESCSFKEEDFQKSSILVKVKE